MLENILGSTTKIKLLRLFFEYPNRDFSTDEVLRNSFVGRGYAGKCLNNLTELEILSTKKVKKEKRFSLNTNSGYFPLIKSLFALEREKYPTLSYIHRNLISDLTEKLDKETMILFGSLAAGTATPESDIDLLIIGNRKEIAREACKRIGEKYKVKIQGIVLTESELNKRISEKSRFLKNIGKEKIFIKGDAKLVEKIEKV